MTTTKTQLPPMRPFTPAECDALAAAGITAEGEQASVLAGTRLFTVDEYLDMEKTGILHEDTTSNLWTGR